MRHFYITEAVMRHYLTFIILPCAIIAGLWSVGLFRPAVPAGLTEIAQAASFKVLALTREYPNAPFAAPVIKKGSTPSDWEVFGIKSTTTREAANIAKKVDNEISYRLRGQLNCLPASRPGCSEIKDGDVHLTRTESVIP
jgi:hypothetical protein